MATVQNLYRSVLSDRNIPSLQLSTPLVCKTEQLHWKKQKDKKHSPLLEETKSWQLRKAGLNTARPKNRWGLRQEKMQMPKCINESMQACHLMPKVFKGSWCTNPASFLIFSSLLLVIYVRHHHVHLTVMLYILWHLTDSHTYSLTA